MFIVLLRFHPVSCTGAFGRASRFASVADLRTGRSKTRTRRASRPQHVLQAFLATTESASPHSGGFRQARGSGVPLRMEQGRAEEMEPGMGGAGRDSNSFAHDGPETRVEHTGGDGAGGVVRDVAAHARAQAFGREMTGGERRYHVRGGGAVEAGQIRRVLPHAIRNAHGLASRVVL